MDMKRVMAVMTTWYWPRLMQTGPVLKMLMKVTENFPVGSLPDQCKGAVCWRYWRRVNVLPALALCLWQTNCYV